MDDFENSGAVEGKVPEMAEDQKPGVRMHVQKATAILADFSKIRLSYLVDDGMEVKLKLFGMAVQIDFVVYSGTAANDASISLSLTPIEENDERKIITSVNISTSLDAGELGMLVGAAVSAIFDCPSLEDYQSEIFETFDTAVAEWLKANGTSPSEDSDS